MEGPVGSRCSDGTPDKSKENASLKKPRNIVETVALYGWLQRELVVQRTKQLDESGQGNIQTVRGPLSSFLGPPSSMQGRWFPGILGDQLEIS